MTISAKLAIIAGAGALPRLVADACRTPPLVMAMQGFTPERLAVDHVFRLETLGGLFRYLAEQGVDQVCLAGAVQRPRIDPTLVDPETAPLLQRIVAAMAQGDDAALRVFLSLFEEAGFDVKGAAEVAPDLLPAPGVLTLDKPAMTTEADAQRGVAVIAAMAQVDLGQACVVAQGQVMAVEALPGTDWMLDALSQRPDGLPKGGILVKAPKPGQDLRVDMPAVGPQTMDMAARAGLDGVVIPAGSVMVLDRAETVARAQALGLFLWVREVA